MTKITRAYKFQISPTPEQRAVLWGTCERARRAWNWAVNLIEDEDISALRAAGVLTGELPDRRKQRVAVLARARAEAKRLQIKLERPPISRGRLYKLWCEMRDSSINTHYHSQVPGYPIERVCKTWKEFFSKKRRARPPKPHGPSHSASFTVQLKRPTWDEDGLKIPGVGYVATTWLDRSRRWGRRCGETIAIPPGKPCSVTVTNRANRWYVSIAMKDIEHAAKPGIGVIGIDLGIGATITTSNGDRYEPPRPLRAALRRLAILQRRRQRKPKRSRRRTRLDIQIATLHARVSNIRAHHLHAISSQLATQYEIVVVEGFDIQDLVHRGVEWRKIRQAMHDIAWGELRRQIDYKLQWNGGTALVCPPLHPTNRQCATCWIDNDVETLNECPPSQKTYRCSSCGATMSRQLNTAKLLEFFGRTGLPDPSTGAQPGSPSGDYARGGAESTARGAAPVKREHLRSRPAPGGSPGDGAFLSERTAADPQKRTQNGGSTPPAAACKSNEIKTGVRTQDRDPVPGVAAEVQERR